MDALRRIDVYVQIGILILSVLLVPFLYFFAPLLGLFFLGIVQLVSALLNTSPFIRNGFKKKIITYWIGALLDLVPVSIGLFGYAKSFVSDILIVMSLGGGFILSIYYIVIYKKLIENLYIKGELSGFTKS